MRQSRSQWLVAGRRSRRLTVLAALSLCLSTSARGDFFDDFEDGLLDPRYSELTASSELDESGGELCITIAQAGDGLEIDTQDFDSRCALFNQLDIPPLSVGDGVSFSAVFENDDETELQIFQIASSTRIKIVQKIGPVTNEVLREDFEGFDADDIGRSQVDWLPGHRIQIEIWLKNGTRVVRTVESISPLTHEENATRAYRIKGVDVVEDPVVCVGELRISETHPVPAVSRWLAGLLAAALLVGGAAARGGSHALARFTPDALLRRRRAR